MGIKISALTPVATPALTDVFPIVQDGVTYKESLTQLTSLFATAGANSNITSLSGLTTPLSIAQGGTASATGNPTFASLTFSPTTSGIVGTTTNDSAGSGKVGQLLFATGGPIVLSTGVSANVANLAVPAGDWNLQASVFFEPAGNMTAVASSISTTSAVLGGSLNTTQLQAAFGTTNAGFPVPFQNVKLAGTTTYYLVANASFATGCNVYGNFWATRVR